MKRTNLEDLPDIEKLHYAIDCVAHEVPIPGVILDFLISEGLYELVVKPKVKYGASRKKHSPRKPGVRS